MYKTIKAFYIVLVCLMLFSSCNSEDVSALSNPINENKASQDIYLDVDLRKLIAEIPGANIKLYYVKADKDFGKYEGIILQTDEGKRYLRWENVTNLAYAPWLMLSDLDKDGKEELVVELCKGYGTGIYDGEVLVIRHKEFGNEVLVENPAIILYKNVTVRELPELFEIVLKNKRITVKKKGRLTPPYSKVGIGWGNNNSSYEVKNNKLYAKVRVEAGIINIGELVIKYKYQDKILQMDSIDFIDYKN